MTDTNDPSNESNAAAIIEAMERLSTPTLIKLPSEPGIVALPNGFGLHSLKAQLAEYLPRPERIKGTAVLDTLDSFIGHVNQFKGVKGGETAALFAKPNALTAVYDYHEPGKPAWCAHSARYTFPVSPEWAAWTRVHDSAMPQAQFAQFLEDRVMDVAAPKPDDGQHFGELGFTLATPAQLLALSRGLSVRVESEAVSKPNLSTGEIEVSFKEQHTDGAGAPLKIPGGFMIQVPPFKDGALYRVPVRLRYRVSSGKISWSVLIYRSEAVLRDAVQEACAKVVEATGLPLYHGIPECD